LFAQVCDFFWWPQLFAQLLGILFMGSMYKIL
jgi:hypothetical protein